MNHRNRHVILKWFRDQLKAVKKFEIGPTKWNNYVRSSIRRYTNRATERRDAIKEPPREPLEYPDKKEQIRQDTKPTVDEKKAKSNHSWRRKSER